ncbi:transglutaminase N-terminal domain-containing protein [Microbacterium koreense]|uniref:Transglutaminase N-terminal domain-containing protein n=1 Tax=Microbacterium koreense TaxID=323761 RepID=A0ABW2ZP45_9MICO
MKYRVTHRTSYTYSGPVQDSVGLFHLVPRTLPWQQVTSSDVTVTPHPDDLNRDVDHFGNATTYFHLTHPHSSLEIAAISDVEVSAPVYDDEALQAPWECARPLVDTTARDAWEATEYALPSPRAAHVDAATEYAAQSLTPGRPLGEAVTDLMRRIHADFAYDGTATTVTSTVADVMRTRAGVCQDFAHLMLAGLRAHGVAARYVSGYLATQPPPGKERIVGADASHAWVAVWVPGSGEWLAVDPTNDQWANDRYITVAWGRDYGDVSPVKGIIVTKAKTSTLNVSVDVAPESEFARTS